MNDLEKCGDCKKVDQYGFECFKCLGIEQREREEVSTWEKFLKAKKIKKHDEYYRSYQLLKKFFRFLCREKLICVKGNSMRCLKSLDKEERC